MSSSNSANGTSRSGPPKKILNDPVHAVSDVIRGLLLERCNTLQKLEGYDVLLERPLPNDPQRVCLVSGGGSGHEPAHAGYIGPGMLTGAVLGGVFASPSVASVLAAIRAVTTVVKNNNNDNDNDNETNTGNGGGCLLVVKNYTGDRLNFGVAAERAAAEGRPVRMVVVGDDCAVPRDRGANVGRRGVAGTVWVHKIAGAAAARGLSLDDVHTLAVYTASRLGSLGVALDAVSLPGASAPNERLADPTTMEVGLGIHGEAGIRQCRLQTSDAMAQTMIDTIRDFGFGDGDGDGDTAACPLRTLQPGDRLAVLVNNLGGLSNFEMSVLTGSLVTYLESDSVGCKVTRTYVGSYMTSFDMQGASVSLLLLDDDDENGMNLSSYLDDTTTAPAWTPAEVRDLSQPRVGPLPREESTEDESAVAAVPSPPPEGYDSMVVHKALVAACRALIEAEPRLTAWDQVVGDGDCGLTVRRGAEAVLSVLSSSSTSSGVDYCQFPATLFGTTLADAVSASMGGTSGVLMELLLRRTGRSLASTSSCTLAQALADGVQAVADVGGARLGDRTMLDALLPAVAVTTSVRDAANAAMEGAQGTATLQAGAGRSTYLDQSTIEGTPDPGAMAVAIALQAVADVMEEVKSNQ